MQTYIMAEKWACFCKSYMCHGALVSRVTWNRHFSCDASLPSYMKTAAVSMPSTASKLQKLDIPLYEGATQNQTLLKSLMTNVLIFVANHGFSLTALDQTIRLQKKNLPSPNEFPSNWSEAEKLLEPYMPRLIQYEACSNDCIMYRIYKDGRDFSKLQSCLICENERKGSGKKIVHYYSLSQRFIRDFGEANIIKLCHGGALR